MVSFTFHRRSTYVFSKKISKSIVLETLTEIIYPSAGSMALGKTLCPPIKTTVDIYTSIQIFPVYLFLNFCVLLILLLSSIVEHYKKTAKVEVTILYLQEDNTLSLRGCHITPIRQTNCPKQSCLTQSWL